MDKVNLAHKFGLIDDYWNPRVVGELNGQHVKLARLEGEFIWHHHDNEDELFFVVDGRLRMEFRDHAIELGPGEFLIVPRGLEHRPVAVGEVRLMLFEPASTLNTGNIVSERTVRSPDRL